MSTVIKDEQGDVSVLSSPPATPTSHMEGNDQWPSPVISGKMSVQPTVRKKRQRDPMLVERTNLLNVSKLVIKELIDSSFNHGRMLDMDHLPLQQFFIIVEHILRHGIKLKKGIMMQKKEYWNLLEQVEKYMPEAAEITATVKELPEIKTPAGRGRAWLRLALMQKTLADYFRCLLEHKDSLLSDYYDADAFMCCDEGMIFSGLLVGLNIIDCNFCLKEEDLDYQLGVIDFSLYLKDSIVQQGPLKVGGALCEAGDQTPGGAAAVADPASMTAVLDQKNYIEELNRHLNATVTNLQQKVEALTTTNALMKEDLAISKNTIITLQEDGASVRGERDSLLQSHALRLQSMKLDVETERHALQTSRGDLDSLFVDTAKKLEEEKKERKDVDKELQLQLCMKQEMEIAMKLLEKDIHEKQDTMISLRRQLDDIKAINLEMYKKLQECQGSLQHKTELVAKLEHKTNQMAATITNMEQRERQLETDRQSSEEKARNFAQQLVEKDQQRSLVETDLKIEREWRVSLQKALAESRDNLTSAQNHVTRLQQTEKEHLSLQENHHELKLQCREQEQALSEMGSHLSEEKLRVDDLKEVSKMTTEAAWTSDKEVNRCRQCELTFSVARRKHHCRHCGDIFCGLCSDNTMPLPSSAKPVRVCDTCYAVLLRRYNAKT